MHVGLKRGQQRGPDFTTKTVASASQDGRPPILFSKRHPQTALARPAWPHASTEQEKRVVRVQTKDISLVFQLKNGAYVIVEAFCG